LPRAHFHSFPNSSMAQTATPPARSEPDVHRSLALSVLLQQLEPGRKYSILDLGQACSENINFWAQYPVRLWLPDFYRSLNSSIAAAAEDISHESLFEQALSDALESRFDIILVWDIFNYLELERLESFIGVLRKICHHGTYLFVLISTLHQIPTEPTHFRILDRERLAYENPSPVARQCPRYQPRDVKLMMSGFEVLASFLLRHGMQEYLFLCHDPSH
jgi:hypothetical protein